MKEITGADMTYCSRCIYAPPLAHRLNYLCDYISITGKPRGCPPGVGCKRRRIRKKEKP